MSYSKLAQYVCISPNSNPRNHKIDKITVHHAAGVVSVEALGALFADPARQASANYGIGSDGRIACFVEEERRAWTSGSQENDHRAITIEVANCGGGPDWPISDEAYESLILLCTDICRRHGFWLNFTGDAKGSLTMHRYFASTLCPGPYLAKRFPQIAQAVNARLEGEAPVPEKKEEAKQIYSLPLRLLRKGDSGEDVRALQILLKGNGYQLGPYGPKGDGIDGEYGAKTVSAVRALQGDRDLDVDGMAGPQVMNALLGL